MVCLTTRRGFTLIELLVVISIISILAAVVLANFADSREQAKIARATEELKNIETALTLYKREFGAMPGLSTDPNPCTLCGFRPASVDPNETIKWVTHVVQVVNPAIGSRLPTMDPWERRYAYMNNFLGGTPTLPSIVCSLGPDELLQTWLTDGVAATERTAQGDDICIFINEVDDSP